MTGQRYVKKQLGKKLFNAGEAAPLCRLAIGGCDQKNTLTSRLAVFWSVSKEDVSLMPYLLLQ